MQLQTQSDRPRVAEEGLSGISSAEYDEAAALGEGRMVGCCSFYEAAVGWYPIL